VFIDGPIEEMAGSANRPTSSPDLTLYDEVVNYALSEKWNAAWNVPLNLLPERYALR
jgi:hypothetical protein